MLSSQFSLVMALYNGYLLFASNGSNWGNLFFAEAAVQRCSQEKAFWKYVANLLENTCACRNAISIKLLCNFVEITLRHGCSPVNLLHIFRTTFLRNTSGQLLLTLGTLSFSFSFEKILIHSSFSSLFLILDVDLKNHSFSYGYILKQIRW